MNMRVSCSRALKCFSTINLKLHRIAGRLWAFGDQALGGNPYFLRLRRMSGMRGASAALRATNKRQQRAVLVGQFEIAWLDRGDTTNGSYEPILFIRQGAANVGNS